MAITRKIIKVEDIDHLEETNPIKTVYSREDCEREVQNGVEGIARYTAQKDLWQARLDEFPVR